MRLDMDCLEDYLSKLTRITLGLTHMSQATSPVSIDRHSTCLCKRTLN